MKKIPEETIIKINLGKANDSISGGKFILQKTEAKKDLASLGNEKSPM